MTDWAVYKRPGSSELRVLGSLGLSDDLAMRLLETTEA